MLTIETIHETVQLTVNALDLTKYVLKTELAEFKTSVELEFDGVREAISLKADKSYVDGEIGKIKIPSLDGYATEQYVDHKFNSLDLSDYATKEYVKDQIDLIPEVDLTPYATKVYVQDEIGKIEIPSLSGYATESYVNEKIESLPEIDLSSYATIKYVNDAIADIPSGDIDLSEYRKLTDNEFNGILKINCEDDGLGTGIFFFNKDEETFRANIVTNNAGMQFNQQFDGHLTSVLVPSDGSRGTMATREWVIDYITRLESRIQELENKE